MKNLSQLIAIFRRDTRGTIAVLTAIMIFPLLVFSAGVPIDLARQVQLRSSLQNIADGAALAGSALLGEGGTAYQACTIANNFVQASSYTGLAVPYSGLSPAGAFATTASYVKAGQATTNIGCSNNAPNTTSLTNLENTTPNQVTVTISANLPTTFMSFLRKTLPITVSATAVGPSNTITICIDPQVSGSIDYDALWYYAYVPATNTLETTGVLGTTPTAFSEGSSTDPSVDGTKAEFLDDDNGNGPLYYLANLNPSPCPTSYVPVAVHLPIATRLGFEMTAQRGGKNPCPYASSLNAAGILSGISLGSLQGSAANACVQGDPGAPFPANEGNKSLVKFYRDAYGSSVFTTNRYYSTDYPATLNSSTTSKVSTADSGGDSAGDFSPTNQALVASTNYSGQAALPQVATAPPTIPHIVFFNNRAAIANVGGLHDQYGVAYESADLVCEVYNGAVVTPTSITPVNSILTPGLDYSNISISSAQQQNLAVVNTTQGNVMQCANTTDGSPYSADPTCKQLNGASLEAFWNDLGSPQYDNVGYGDMPYLFQCVAQSGIATLDFKNTALDQ